MWIRLALIGSIATACSEPQRTVEEVVAQEDGSALVLWSGADGYQIAKIRDGELAWRTDVTSNPHLMIGPPTVVTHDGIVVVRGQSTDGMTHAVVLEAFDVEDGERRWETVLARYGDDVKPDWGGVLDFESTGIDAIEQVLIHRGESELITIGPMTGTIRSRQALPKSVRKWRRSGSHAVAIGGELHALEGASVAAADPFGFAACARGDGYQYLRFGGDYVQLVRHEEPDITHRSLDIDRSWSVVACTEYGDSTVIAARKRHESRLFVLDSFERLSAIDVEGWLDTFGPNLNDRSPRFVPIGTRTTDAALVSIIDLDQAS